MNPKDFINSIYYDGEGFVYLIDFIKINHHRNKKVYQFSYMDYNKPYDGNFMLARYASLFSIGEEDILKTNLINSDIIYIGYALNEEKALQICKEYIVFL